MSLHDIFQSIAGQESAELEAPVIAIAETTAEEAAEAIVDKEIAEVEKDVAENCADIDKQATAIEAVEEKVEDLQEQIDGMEAMMNGSTPFNAALFAHHYSRGAKIVAKFGAAVDHHGAESFADASTANLNALAGCESMKDTAMKAAGAVKQFFINLFNSFIAAMVGIFNKFKGIEKKAEIVKAKVAKSEGGKGEVTRTGKMLYCGPTGGVDHVAKAVTKAGTSLAIALAAGNPSEMVSDVTKVANDLAAMGKKTVKGSDAATETWEVAVQDAIVTIVVPKTEAGLSKVKLTHSASNNSSKAPALDKSKLSSICDSVIAEAKTMQGNKLGEASLKKARDQAIGKMEKKTEEGQAARNTVRAGCNAAMELMKGSMGVAADTLTGALMFVDANLGGKAAAETGANKLEDKSGEDKKED